MDGCASARHPHHVLCAHACMCIHVPGCVRGHAGASHGPPHVLYVHQRNAFSRVCVFICMLCMCTGTLERHMGLRACMCARALSKCIYVCAFMCIYVRVCMCRGTLERHMGLRACMCAHALSNAYMYVRVCMCIYVHVCMCRGTLERHMGLRVGISKVFLKTPVQRHLDAAREELVGALSRTCGSTASGGSCVRVCLCWWRVHTAMCKRGAGERPIPHAHAPAPPAVACAVCVRCPMAVACVTALVHFQ
jgi:hypothetical protein